MAYNIFIDNAISYGYIKSDKFDATTLSSGDLLPIVDHTDHGNEVLFGKDQKHIIANALRNLSANINDAGKYGAMFIKINDGHFNLSDIDDNDGNWRLFVSKLSDSSSSSSTNFTRIYRKSGDGYERVTDVTTLTADDNTTRQDGNLENEYVLVYGYQFIREYGRSVIKVPMMPNRYSVFTDGNVHVRVNNGSDGWNTQDNELTDIFVDGTNVRTPADYYGEYQAKVTLDGWIKEQQGVENRNIVRKWNTSDDYAHAQTGDEAGFYSILKENNDHNELYIWFDEVSGNIYLGTHANATFESYYPSSEGDYIPATGGHAVVIVQPDDYHTFDVNDNIFGENQITFDNEVGDTTSPTIESVTRDANTGKVTITLNGVDDEILGDSLPKINVTPRQTKLKISAVYHKFDPFVGRGDGQQQTISDLNGRDLVFDENGYTVTELDNVTVTPPDTFTNGDIEYVYFGLSKGVDAVSDGSLINDTATFNVADDENKNLIKTKDNSVVYHLYYVSTSDLYAEVTLTNVHEYYTQSGPTDESGMYLNNGEERSKQQTA